ncbi:hypothetical protein ACIRJS_26540 [Streptomyces sp. NPDC102340]|uniref:hypothetical protein n=1 Tax=unclassified Streptomyces TaxID=2593676 RepID=UPI0038125CFB
MWSPERRLTNTKALQLGVFAVSVAGYVVLAVSSEATAEYVALASPALGAAFLMTHLGRQDVKLDQINENTNGVLDQRIERVVRRAIEEPPQ